MSEATKGFRGSVDRANDAIIELATLRKENDRLKDQVGQTAEVNLHLAAENKRLKADKREMINILYRLQGTAGEEDYAEIELLLLRMEENRRERKNET